MMPVPIASNKERKQIKNSIALLTCQNVEDVLTRCISLEVSCSEYSPSFPYGRPIRPNVRQPTRRPYPEHGSHT